MTEMATDGRPFEVIDIVEAIAELPWVDQTCPLMPHQYAVLAKSPEWAWFALDAMVAKHPDSYRAYFRGYPTPNRYWEAPDGLRYWRTFTTMNRCTLDSVEPRRVDQGAKLIKDWGRYLSTETPAGRLTVGRGKLGRSRCRRYWKRFGHGVAAGSSESVMRSRCRIAPASLR